MNLQKVPQGSSEKNLGRKWLREEKKSDKGKMNQGVYLLRGGAPTGGRNGTGP